MSKETILKMKAEYEAQCAETARIAKKAMLTLAMREANRSTKH